MTSTVPALRVTAQVTSAYLHAPTSFPSDGFNPCGGSRRADVSSRSEDLRLGGFEMPWPATCSTKRMLSCRSPRRPRLALLATAFVAIGTCTTLACGTPTSDAASPTGEGQPPGSGSPDSGSPVVIDTDSSSPSPPPAPDASDASSSADDAALSEDAALAGWTLTWSDEFDLPDGSPVDSTKWNQETGNGGWKSNKELEYYTPGTANAVIEDGSLVISATNVGASALTCGYGTCEYTSARFNTSGKFDQAYGLFEARIRDPAGPGPVARVLDARRQHRLRRLAPVRRDRHHGEHRQDAVEPTTGAFTGPATPVITTSLPATRSPTAASSATPFTSTTSSGKPTRSASTSTVSSTRRGRPPTCRPGTCGSTTTPST